MISLRFRYVHMITEYHNMTPVTVFRHRPAFVRSGYRLINTDFILILIISSSHSVAT
nr:MAG TPA_asm: hypothetical protein [Bacteriophage sp.]